MARLGRVAIVLALVIAMGLPPAANAQSGRRDVVIGMIQEPDVLNSVITSTAASNFVMKAMMNLNNSLNL